MTPTRRAAPRERRARRAWPVPPAPRGHPRGTRAPLASSLPASAVNVGIAVGSLAGGAAVTASGVTAAVMTGAVIAGVAVAAAWATSVIRQAADPALLPPSAELVSHR
jgi:hypothetical protein